MVVLLKIEIINLAKQSLIFKFHYYFYISLYVFISILYIITTLHTTLLFITFHQIRPYIPYTPPSLYITFPGIISAHHSSPCRATYRPNKRPAPMPPSSTCRLLSPRTPSSKPLKPKLDSSSASPRASPSTTWSEWSTDLSGRISPDSSDPIVPVLSRLLLLLLLLLLFLLLLHSHTQLCPHIIKDTTTLIKDEFPPTTTSS